MVFLWLRMKVVLRLTLVILAILEFVLLAVIQTFHPQWMLWCLYHLTLFFLILLNFFLLSDGDRIPEGVGPTTYHICE